MTAPRIVTFGCRLNAYESEVIRDHLAGTDGRRPTVVINTCSVTGEAERQARQAIRRQRRLNPEARIVVTGCAAQIAPDRYAEMPEVDHVVGNREKLAADTWSAVAAEVAPTVLVGPLERTPETEPALLDGSVAGSFGGRSRAVIEVQQGCDHACTFCIIPRGRGPSRSVPVGVVAERVRRMVARGYGEVVFSGVDITSYGADLPGRTSLGQMIRRVLALNPELGRLRLSSLDPAEIDPDLWRLIAEEPRLAPHLHLSVQAGDDMILRRMKRRHARTDVIEASRRARRLRPDIVLGADLIAGFPTETDAMFGNTEALIGEAGLALLHVFPYSARASTPAARMPQVPSPVRRRRAERLRAAGQAVLDATMSAMIGRTVRGLMESGGFGHTEHFLPIRADAPVAAGALFDARVTAVSDGALLAHALQLHRASD